MDAVSTSLVERTYRLEAEIPSTSWRYILWMLTNTCLRMLLEIIYASLAPYAAVTAAIKKDATAYTAMR